MNNYSNGFGDTGQNDIVSVVWNSYRYSKMDSKTWTTVNRPNYTKNLMLMYIYSWRWGRQQLAICPSRLLSSVSLSWFLHPWREGTSSVLKIWLLHTPNPSICFRSTTIVHVAVNNPISDVWRSQKYGMFLLTIEKPLASSQSWFWPLSVSNTHINSF